MAKQEFTVEHHGSIVRESLWLWNLATLVDLFEAHGIKVSVSPGMPMGVYYAMFTLDFVGIIDNQSLMNITGGAWVRNPATVIRDRTRSIE